MSNPEIVDLCSDDDEATVSVSAEPKTTIQSSHASASRKKQKIADASVAARNSFCSDSRQKNEEASPFIFLSSDGSDNAIVTNGLLSLFRDKIDNPNVVSCAGKLSSLRENQRMLCLRHIQQNDKWSCGFRNLQMMLTAVVSLLPSHHSYYQQQSQQEISATRDYFCIPSLHQLQHAMERQWAAGYDRAGAQHYRYKIVGKQAQIGAVEVSTCLSFAGIDSTIVQFIRCFESRRFLGRFCAAYFSKSYCGTSTVCPYCSALNTTDVVTSKSTSLACVRIAESGGNLSLSSSLPSPRSCSCPSLPLYLQWEGHSVTVVGVEMDASGDTKNLLVFDPIKEGSRLKEALQQGDLQPFRLALCGLQPKDCQIVVASIQPLSLADMEQRKTSSNISVTATEQAVLRTVNCRTTAR